MSVDPRYYAAKTVTVWGKSLEITVFTEPTDRELGTIRVSEIWAANRPSVTMDTLIAKQAIVQLIGALQAMADHLSEEL